jgi:hypothetical protein
MNEFRAAVGLDLHAWQSRAHAASRAARRPRRSPPSTRRTTPCSATATRATTASGSSSAVERRAVGRPELDAYKAIGVLTEPKTLSADLAAVMTWNYPEKK